MTRPRKVSLGKTTRPSVSGVLPRRRLFELLKKDHAVTWITGPPGCGKTTLAASWLDQAKVPSLWYQLDEGDADVASFFYHLGRAVMPTGKSKPAPLPRLTPEYHAGLPAFARRYFQALYERLGASFAITTSKPMPRKIASATSRTASSSSTTRTVPRGTI